MKRKQEQSKFCETCGVTMYRKRFNGTLEDLTAFLKRRFCSLSCANTRKQVSRAGLRWRAEQMRSQSCEVCGAKLNRHAHHCDGNIANNSPENIQTLCGTCHAKHHHSTRRRGMMIAGRMESCEWLMGYPAGWTDLRDSETPSSRRSPTRSSRQSGTS